MKRCLLDTNVVLRFLLQDHPKMSAGAMALFEKCGRGNLELHLHPAILAEVVFVLNGFYKLPRRQICDTLLDLFELPGLKLDDAAIAQDALKRFARSNVDFADALLAALGAGTSTPVASYDRDFDKFPDVVRCEPG